MIDVARTPKNRQRSPAKQAGSPLNGVIPPVHARFKPGQSGNPAGRPIAGLSVKEWLNEMQDWPRAKLTAVLEDESAPAAKVTAARVWFHAMTSALNASGSPIAGAEFDRILDRTIGKPAQSMDVTSQGEGISFAFVTATPTNAPDDPD